MLEILASIISGIILVIVCINYFFMGKVENSYFRKGEENKIIHYKL